MNAEAAAPTPSLERLLEGGPRLSVGMLTADLLDLGSELRLLAGTGAELVHIDVMDGVFCPQITLGQPVVKAIRTPLLKDVHLMIDDPLSKVESFVQAGADMITFHLEGARQPHRVLQALGAAANANDPGHHRWALFDDEPVGLARQHPQHRHRPPLPSNPSDDVPVGER